MRNHERKCAGNVPATNNPHETETTARIDMLDRAADPRTLLDLVKERGGTAISAANNPQPAGIPPIASVHFAGISAIGRTLDGAAREWLRHAAHLTGREVRA